MSDRMPAPYRYRTGTDRTYSVQYSDLNLAQFRYLYYSVQYRFVTFNGTEPYQYQPNIYDKAFGLNLAKFRYPCCAISS
ncbi:hypothetical protein Hanom_Chr10g00933361 [Helianthus anomalus]